MTKSLPRAQELLERANRERTQIVELEARLLRLREKHQRTSSAMWKALPEGYGITLSKNEPWEIVGPFEDSPSPAPTTESV